MELKNYMVKPFQLIYIASININKEIRKNKKFMKRITYTNAKEEGYWTVGYRRFFI